MTEEWIAGTWEDLEEAIIIGKIDPTVLLEGKAEVRILELGKEQVIL